MVHDLLLSELDLPKLLLWHDFLQHLSVEVPQEGAPVFHQDDVADTQQNDVVRHGRGDAGPLREGHAEAPLFDAFQDLSGVPQIHHVIENLVIGLLDDGEVLQFVEPVKNLLGAKLLPTNRDFVAPIVPQDHEAPSGAMSEPLLEEFRIPHRPTQEILQVRAPQESDDLLQLHPLRDRYHEVVVSHRDPSIASQGVGNGKGIGPRQGVVGSPAETVVKDDVPVSPNVDISLDDELLIRGDGGNDGLLFQQVVDSATGRTGIQPGHIHEPSPSTFLSVSVDDGERLPAHGPDLAGEVVTSGQHLACPGGDCRSTTGGILDVDSHPPNPLELVRPSAKDEDISPAQVFHELFR